MHHAKVEETISQAKALMKAMKTGGMVAEVSNIFILVLTCTLIKGFLI